MIRKLVTLSLVILYLYHLTFSIFLNSYFRYPTPILFGLPLVILFREKIVRFEYFKEVFWLITASFLINYIGNADSKEFFIDSLVIFLVGLFFNYFVGYNKDRLRMSVSVFYSLLFLSTCVMFLNHLYRAPITSLRSQLIGAEIAQSPSGITGTIFSFGYQLAALVSFLLIYVFVYHRTIVTKVLVLSFCLAAIYFGLQRSVLVTFALSAMIFFVAYYKLRSLPVMFFIAVIGLVFSSFFLQETSNYDNIFAKNERKGDENRANLTIENLKIYTDYPYGLVFHGKNWDEVTRDNPVYRGGLTSHNAYLMFITYLGPFVGFFLLLMIYYRPAVIFKNALFNIRDPENALLVSLCFSFLAVSLNSLFHNAWLVGANGPTIFIYFSILSYYKQHTKGKELDFEK
jgi:hypothetical protein